MRNYEIIQEFEGRTLTDENTINALEDMYRYDNCEYYGATCSTSEMFTIRVRSTSRIRYYNGFTIDRWRSFGFRPTDYTIKNDAVSEEYHN